MPNKRLKAADLSTRSAAKDDGPILADFHCSSGEWFENEVEEYLNQKAINQVIRDGGMHYRLLLTLKEEQLVACAGHHLEPLLIDHGESGKIVEFVRLHVLAISSDFQGRKLEDGTALADGVLRLAVADAVETHGEKPLTGIVANENYRSKAVLERNGRWSQVRYGSRYVRFVGAMRLER